MLNTAKEYLTDVFNLFYPKICLSCSAALLRSEEIVCNKCQRELPQTGHWNNAGNKLMQRLWGRVNLQGAAALYHFNKDSGVQHLLHQLKYRGRKDVGKYLGTVLGDQLKLEGTIIKDIDVITPVPLHWKKEKKRGYNQCDPIAEGLSESLQIPYTSSALMRPVENVSQTGKNRFERWQNVADIFDVKDAEQLKDRHVLLVDDVVTTGATAEACLHTILTVPGTKVSFVAVAAAAV